MTQTVRSEPPLRKITFEEFMARGEEEFRSEWVDGEIIEMTPPSNPHQRLSDYLVTLLQMFLELQSLGQIRSAILMRLALRPSGRIPDILYVSNERLALLQHNYLDGPADLAIEIISPESKRRD